MQKDEMLVSGLPQHTSQGKQVKENSPTLSLYISSCLFKMVVPTSDMSAYAVTILEVASFPGLQYLQMQCGYDFAKARGSRPFPDTRSLLNMLYDSLREESKSTPKHELLRSNDFSPKCDIRTRNMVMLKF
jgi:hypothetical protein